MTEGLSQLTILCVVQMFVACQVSPPASSRPTVAPRAGTASAAPSLAPSTGPPVLPTIDRPTSTPYAGDPSIFEHPKRAERLQIEKVMDLLGIAPDTTVADVGAGGGWFAVRAARRVGPLGLVYAVEINPEYVAQIAARARREQLSNLRSLLGSEADPGLPKSSLDAVLLLKTYHELSAPLAMLQRLRSAMRPSARLGIIDRNGRGDDHGIDEAVVRSEVTSAGFNFRERHDWKSPEERVEYFLVFVR